MLPRSAAAGPLPDDGSAAAAAGRASAAPAASSRLQLPPGGWDSVLACLCDHFPRIPAAQWHSRMVRGLVTDAAGRTLPVTEPYRAGLEVRYRREVAVETPIPFDETIVHLDDDLLVVDKPHFLAVVPAGRHVEETLLGRLVRRLGNAELAPLHRLDAATAGLVLFSVRPATRGLYQALFRERRIDKEYLAIAPTLAGLAFPQVRRSRLEAGVPFFRMHEVQGEPNAVTRIELEGAAGLPAMSRYVLRPVTGRKHQLRVHMAALGAGIVGDPWYPTLSSTPTAPEDFTRPLQLLARQLRFIDPLGGGERLFRSARTLQAESAPGHQATDQPQGHR